MTSDIPRQEVQQHKHTCPTLNLHWIEGESKEIYNVFVRNLLVILHFQSRKNAMSVFRCWKSQNLI